MPPEISRAALPSRTDSRSEIVSVFDSLRSIVKALRESSREAEQTLGVSSAQLYVLQELNATPDMSVNELAARTQTHQSSVSMTVSRLVENRLVLRGTSKSDGRKVSLSVSSAGKALLRRVPETSKTTLGSALKEMSRSELRSLAAVLADLAARMAAHDGNDAGARRKLRVSSKA